MRSSTILAMSACFWLASYGAGLAQPVENGLEVRVNPSAAGGTSNVLLYPGGEYSRVVPQLLYPGQKNGPIALHLPTKRRVSVARTPETAPAPEAATPAPEAAPAPKPKPKPKKVAKAEPAAPAPAQPSEQYDNSGYTSFANPNNFANVFGSGAPAKPAPKPTAPKPAPAPTQVAKASPPPAPASASENAGLAKRSVILFAKDAPDPAKGALGSIKFLAGDLNAAMNGPTARVELQAFGGTPGDKGSDARRLSLKRALAIRQILIDDGVSPDRIDVRAMGGADDSGPADRVDVYVKA
jgi:outer membrane protein OmpA-like peptidoglycan-associated protein